MKYLTVSECLRRNGDRHAANAARHLENGRPDYAAGSMRKAERNWARAKLFDPPAWTKPLIDLFAAQVAAEILKGDRIHE